MSHRQYNCEVSSPSPSDLSTEQRAAAGLVARDLAGVFGTRLQAVVAYCPIATVENAEVHTLALVERLTFDDLAACLPLADRWQRSGAAVPLILGRDEFERSLDVFPLEYGDIIAQHVTITGIDPFAGSQVADADLRRACELQAKSHLLHLREGYLESGGDARRIARLVASSAPAFRSLLRHIGRLDARRINATDDELAAITEQTIGVPAALVRDVFAASAAGQTIVDPAALLARYVAATERIWHYVDGWRLGA